jgi:hypothetical protein
MIKDVRDSDPDSGKNFRLGIAQGVTLLLERDMKSLDSRAAKLANDAEVIPREEAPDRLLRAETATERNLNRAIDRLEYLQRCRQGKSVPLLLRVGLTR